MSARRDDLPEVAIPRLLGKFDNRQRQFEHDRDRTRRKFHRRIQKINWEIKQNVGNGAAELAGIIESQEHRKQLFTEGMIGPRPSAWALRKMPKKCDLPVLPREPYHDSPGKRPKRRFSDPNLFNEYGLSAAGLSRLDGSGLPNGWTEHRIGDTFTAADAQVATENAIALDEKNSTILDKGRVYFYHEETGQVCWAPPKGSSPLAHEAFFHFGHVRTGPVHEEDPLGLADS